MVYDNGEGFGELDLNKVFEFGFSNTGGTGIGLYNVKTVVEKMGGCIIASKNDPCGAKFVINFR